MNDVRNLMDNLHAHVEYKEFDAGQRASPEAWSVLQRIRQASDGELAAAPVAQPPPAAPAVAPAPVRSTFLNQTSLLKRYAATPAMGDEPDGESVRRLPLADVFARLERPGR